MGDSNEFFDELLKFGISKGFTNPNELKLNVKGKIISIYIKNTRGTCCVKDMSKITPVDCKSTMIYKSDIIGSNVPISVNVDTRVGPCLPTTNKYSDHLPVYGSLEVPSVPPPGGGEAAKKIVLWGATPPGGGTAAKKAPIKQYQYSIYVTPALGKYRGLITPYFKTWGGKSPHSTITSFNDSLSENQLNTILQDTFITGKKAKGKWSIRGGLTYVKRRNYDIFEFTSGRIENIKKILETKNLPVKKEKLHFTCGNNVSKKDTANIKANILACKDWVLTIARREKKTNKVEWRYFVDLYNE